MILIPSTLPGVSKNAEVNSFDLDNGPRILTSPAAVYCSIAKRDHANQHECDMLLQDRMTHSLGIATIWTL
jgi:hypothetical protein